MSAQLSFIMVGSEWSPVTPASQQGKVMCLPWKNKTKYIVYFTSTVLFIKTSNIELKITKQCEEAEKCDPSSGGKLANVGRHTEDPDPGMSKQRTLK